MISVIFCSYSTPTLCCYFMYCLHAVCFHVLCCAKFEFLLQGIIKGTSYLISVSLCCRTAYKWGLLKSLS